MHMFGAAAGAAVVVLLTAGSASAHVTVNAGDDARPDAEAVVTFRVPTESDTATTAELKVALPADTPLISADVQPKPGWTATVEHKDLSSPLTDDDGNKVTQYVSAIDWKTIDPTAAIPSDDFDTFSVLIGPLPDVDQVVFPAVQTYSDGHTVSWVERSADGRAMPEHPAPTLQIVHEAAPAKQNPAWPAWVGFGTGIVGLLAAAVALARSRKA
jgi:uncharacterized protein